MGLQRVGHHWATELNWLKVKEILFKQSASKKSASVSFYFVRARFLPCQVLWAQRGWPVEVGTLPTVVLHHNQHCISWLGKSRMLKIPNSDFLCWNSLISHCYWGFLTAWGQSWKGDNVIYSGPSCPVLFPFHMLFLCTELLTPK